MFTELVFSLFQTFTFFAFCILITITIMTLDSRMIFATQIQAIFSSYARRRHKANNFVFVRQKGILVLEL